MQLKIVVQLVLHNTSEISRILFLKHAISIIIMQIKFKFDPTLSE